MPMRQQSREDQHPQSESVLHKVRGRNETDTKPSRVAQRPHDSGAVMSKKLFKTDKELQAAIDGYFAACNDKPTITGLAYHLGFESRQSFYDYEKNQDHSYTIKRARLAIEASYEGCLRGNNVAGPIFALKNLGWKDKQELEHTGKDGEAIEFTDTARAARIATILDRGRKERDRQTPES